MSAEGPSRTHMVLLVDDDLRTTRRMAEMLREDGLAVEIARDGAAAVARLAREPVPDALVTELTTAHVDGTAVSRFARTQRPGLPVMIVTGYPNLFVPNAYAGPPALLFTKPVDYTKLKEALLRELSQRAVSEPPPAEKPVVGAIAALESVEDDASGNALRGAEAIRSVRKP